jgi:hypothetical protein
MSEKNCKDPPAKDDDGVKEDSAELERRAAVYGLTAKDLLDDSLVVPEGRHVIIDGESIKQKGIVTLAPKTIDDVKRWIGVPDETAAKGQCCRPPPSSIEAVNTASDLRKQGAAAAHNLRAVADAYVNGDSRRVAAYAPMLNHLLDRASIIGIFLRRDIDIHRGATLEIGRNNRVLFARHIRIWTGGTLLVRGDAKIDCVTISGGINFSVADIVTSVALGRFKQMEMAHG